MVLNTNGLVILDDKTIPSTWTAKAGGDISGGQFLTIVSGNAPVTHDISSYTNGDIIAVTGASGANVLGIALKNVASGTNAYVPYATKGLFLVTAGGAVDPETDMNVEIYSDSVQTAVAYNNVVGRAWTNTGSGSSGCTILSLDL